jgi:hypothetical protein
MTPTQLTLCTQSAATPQQSDEITKLVKKHGADWVPIAHNSRLTYTTGGEEELEAEEEEEELEVEEEACFDSIAAGDAAMSPETTSTHGPLPIAM